MKTKILHRRIYAPFTSNAGEIDRLISEAEKITLPKSLYEKAADIAATVQSNTRDTEPDQAATIAAYVLRYGLILSKAGELKEAPPRPKRQPKPKESAI